MDRTRRIGQTRNVMVYRPIAKDTIEEIFSSTLDADGIRVLPS